MAWEDPRTGPPESGQVQVTSGDGTAPQTALEIPDTALFRLEGVVVSYADAASATTDVTFFDDADGTTAGNVSDSRHVMQNLDPGEEVAVDFDGMRDFEEDVLVQCDGSQDGNVEVTVMGTLMVALTDSTHALGG